MRLAWFSPLLPVRSGISAYSAELLPLLEPTVVIDRYPESSAHEFVWKMRRQPYDLAVYQLGNAPCHDYMWAYLAHCPGLVVLHDARLHHARARRLLHQKRFDDYRREFEYDHPDAPQAFAEYAVEGLGGPIYYFWRMLRVVMQTARLVAVHNARVASELTDEYPGVAIETIRMGVPAARVDPDAGVALRRRLAIREGAIVFAAFGKVTAEKRIEAMLRAIAALSREGRNAYLMLVGDAGEYPTLEDEISRHGIRERVRVTGHVADDAIGDHLAAADVCLCLRWPTAQETSASWLRCLSAGRPTVITDLSHLVDIPSSVVTRINPLDEDRELEAAMRRLADDERVRQDLGRAGRAYWAAGHTMELMASDYRRLLAAAAARPAPVTTGLPPHFVDDYSARTMEIVRHIAVPLDLLPSS